VRGRGPVHKKHGRKKGTALDVEWNLGNNGIIILLITMKGE
jgi:hypothetical protein